MDNQSQDFDLNQKQKSRLLSLGLGTGPRASSSDADEQKMDRLYDILAGTLPMHRPVADSLPPVMRGLSSGLQSLAGRPIGDLLQDPTTDIATIERIKEYAKDSGTSADSEGKSDAFLVVYYAAIASALTFHNKKITQHSYKDLEQFFLSFMGKQWILEEIKGLFRRARTHSRRIARATDSPEE